MKASGVITRFMAMEFIFGKMDASIMDIGNKTICKVMASTSMQMEYATTANIKWTRKRVLEFTIGQTVANTRVGGTRVNSTALENILTVPKVA